MTSDCQRAAHETALACGEGTQILLPHDYVLANWESDGLGRRTQGSVTSEKQRAFAGRLANVGHP
jgi:hypothetical protein